MNTRPTREQIEAGDEKLRQLIKTHGYVVRPVFCTEEDEDKQNFTYTFGRELVGKPDFIVMTRNGHKFTNEIVAMFDAGDIQIKEDGSSDVFTMDNWLVLVHGEHKPLRVKLKKVKSLAPVIHEYACATADRDLGLTSPVELYQYFIADKNNILPDESGYDVEGFPQPDITNLISKLH